jgi:hypothetical protein
MSSSAEFEEKRERDNEPLDTSIRSRAEEALGQDLSSVRVFRGPEGAAVSDAESARAVTRGQRVYFAPQEYAPGTPDGDRLITHELVHAVQASRTGGTTADRDSLEAEATRVSEEAMTPGRPAVRLSAAPGSQLKQEARTPPTIARHSQEIAPQPLTGTIAGAGFSIPYAYTIVPAPGFSTLVLQVPEGMSVVVTPLTVEAPDYRVQNAEGNRPRAVVVSVNSALVTLPRFQLTFTRGSASYIVLFQFPQAAPAATPAAGPSKASNK